jgi:hypothetical protein
MFNNMINAHVRSRKLLRRRRRRSRAKLWLSKSMIYFHSVNSQRRQRMMLLMFVLICGDASYGDSHDIFSTMKIWSGQPVQLRDKKISFPISVVLHSSPVRCLRISRSAWSYPYAGFSDPIYAEAYVKMHGFDIMLGMYLRVASR